MPGIVGLVTTLPSELAERQLGRMVDILRHESFYETGTWRDSSLGVYVGWSARRPSFCDAMPVRNERGDIVLVFSGEEFADSQITRGREQRGHALNAERCGYLVDLYAADPSFPAGLNGRFHGLLVDLSRRTVTLFNDRYGMHRIYYHQAKEGFYFAAEAKAILAVRPELRRIDPRGLGELVSCGCVMENRTLFADVSVLPAASCWTLRDGAAERKAAYFRPDQWQSQTPLEPETYYQALRDVIARSVPRYFAGGEPIGMSLTGGLDSRIIMAWTGPAGRSLPCYTFAGMMRDCQDALIARQVAQACGQSHAVIRVGDDFLARFPAYAERTVYLTDGCAEVNRAADLHINQAARLIAPVRMTGNYGGEVLRGVRAFKPLALLPGLFDAELRASMRHAEETYAALLQGHPLAFAVFRQAPWYHYGLLALEQTQVSLRSPYLDNELVGTVFRAPPSAGADDAMCLRLIADGNPRLRHIATDRGIGGHGLSATALHALREFQFKAEYAYDYGMPQWLAPIDRLLSPMNPERAFLGRHKFAHFRLWYRAALSEHVREVLLDPRTLALPYFVPKAVEAVVKGHLSGQRNYTTEIHKLLTVELVHRLFTTAAAA